MDRILEQLRSINAKYKIAYSYALKIEGALKKLNDKTSKGIKAKELIKDIKIIQKKSIISHYESKKEIQNTTKEQD